MTTYIITIALGVIFFIATFHPHIGPQVYGTAWPGHYTDPHNKRLAILQCILLGTAVVLIGIIIFLQSFRVDILTIVSLVLLGISAVCVLTGLFVGRLRNQR